MKRKLFIAALVSLVFSLAIPSAAADNPLGIDNACYALYKEVERQLGKDGFATAADLFRQAAIEKKDSKALVIYHVEVLKDYIARPSSEDNDAKVDEAREELKRVAREKNQPYYFYLSYSLSQDYYTKHVEAYRALLLLEEMASHKSCKLLFLLCLF